MALVDTGIRQKTDHGEIATVTDMRGQNVLIDAKSGFEATFQKDLAQSLFGHYPLFILKRFLTLVNNYKSLA